MTTDQSPVGAGAPTPRFLGPASQLFIAAGMALFWELALIRWFGACVRIVAYYSNFVLISAFFGLGAGALLARRAIRLERFLFPMLALTLAVAVQLSEIPHANPSSPDEFHWIAGGEGGGAIPLWLLLPLIYVLCACIFVIFGQWIGRLFAAHTPLRAYSIDIGGSIAGIALFALLSALSTSPFVWFVVGFSALFAILPANRTDRIIAAASVVAALAVAFPYSSLYEWSPYYKIHVQPLTATPTPDRKTIIEFDEPVGAVVSVNNDYHQMLLNLGHTQVDHDFIRSWRALYDAPYVGAARLPDGPILVVGAGTGNDVAAALRNTRREVHAVEIDPQIQALGARLHGEAPYSDPRLTVHIDDARSFFQRTEHKYALVVFGFLDSHTLLSSFSSLRLDNFVYTVESIQQVKRILHTGGRVALTFTTGTDWIHERLIGLLTAVFGPDTKWSVPGTEPNYGNGTLYSNTKTDEAIVEVVDGVAKDGHPLPTDDWPFLYLRDRTLPDHYRGFLVLIIALGFATLLLLPSGKRRIRLPYFFMGAAFFLLETSNVISLSLLYGSTWFVNVLVFAGILTLILLGNLTTSVIKRSLVWPGFALVAVSLLVAAFIPVSTLLAVDNGVARAVAAVVIFLGPVYFASLIFASLIREEEDFAPAYGSNVLGATVGGALEYLSLLLGFRALLFLTLGLYALALLTLLVPGGRARLSRR